MNIIKNIGQKLVNSAIFRPIKQKLGGNMSGAIVVSVIVAISAAVGIGAYWWTGIPDGPVEEYAEEIIKDQIGVSLDLSPGSPEKK